MLWLFSWSGWYVAWFSFFACSSVPSSLVQYIIIRRGQCTALLQKLRTTDYQGTCLDNLLLRISQTFIVTKETERVLTDSRNASAAKITGSGEKDLNFNPCQRNAENKTDLTDTWDSTRNPIRPFFFAFAFCFFALDVRPFKKSSDWWLIEKHSYSNFTWSNTLHE